MITQRQKAAIAAGFLVSVLFVGTSGAESPAPPAYSPGAEALRVELALQYDHGSIERSFYEARGYRPLWLAEDGAAAPAARALLAWVGAADANALPASRYGVSGLATRLAKANSGAYSDASALETDLTRLFLTYGRDISSGLLEPRSISPNIDIEPRRPDPVVLLAGAGATGAIPAFLARRAPSVPA